MRLTLFVFFYFSGAGCGGFPNALVGKETTCSAGDAGDTGDVSSIPGSGRSPGVGNGNPFQYSCLKNPMEEEPGRLQSMGLQKSCI